MIDFTQVGKLIIVAGGLLILIGVLMLVADRFQILGHLPGDIVYKRGRVTFFAPIATMLLVSLLLTVILNLVLRR